MRTGLAKNESYGHQSLLAPITCRNNTNGSGSNGVARDGRCHQAVGGAIFDFSAARTEVYISARNYFAGVLVAIWSERVYGT